MTTSPQMTELGTLSEHSGGLGKLFSKPLFWVIAILALWCMPLLKSLTAELPPPLPGMDGEQVHAELVEETGRDLALADLEGHLVVIGGLSLANGKEAEEQFEKLRRVRKRLRGMGSAVVFLTLVDGASPAELTEFVDSKTARKPLSLFAIDIDHELLKRLQDAAPRPRAEYLLLDTHGRLRGLCEGEASPLDLFIGGVGQLANWRASDPPFPGETPAEPGE